jgi:hypothetical protein
VKNVNFVRKCHKLFHFHEEYDTMLKRGQPLEALPKLSAPMPIVRKERHGTRVLTEVNS